MDISAARAMLGVFQQALAARDRSAINRSAKQLIDGGAPLIAQWKAIAMVLVHNGEFALANRAVDRWIEQSPGDPAATFEKATILARSGRHSEARHAVSQIAPNRPTVAQNAFLKGTIATNLGRFPEARAELGRAAQAAPASGQVWLAYAMAGPASDLEEAALLNASNAISVASEVDRAGWLYGLAKVRLDLGKPVEAFELVDQGARLMRKLHPFDVAADGRAAQEAQSGWTFPETDAASIRPERPIFVTGLPRSGTTLVEQILASHSAVDGGDELQAARIVAQEIGGLTKSHFDRYLTRGGSIAAARGLYLHLLDQRFSGIGRVVDKSIDMSRYLGLIVTLFPGSPIVWLRRDPLDCAWSIYRSWFAQGLNWSWSLEAISQHFLIEDALFEHWRRELGSRMLVVEYSQLVTDIESSVRRIADHCDLTFEQTMLRPENNPRAVTTTSVAQVRVPINRDAIGSAKTVATLLRPFSDAYRR